MEFHHSWKLKMRQRSAQHLIPFVDAEEEEMLVKSRSKQSDLELNHLMFLTELQGTDVKGLRVTA